MHPNDFLLFCKGITGESMSEGVISVFWEGSEPTKRKEDLHPKPLCKVTVNEEVTR